MLRANDDNAALIITFLKTGGMTGFGKALCPAKCCVAGTVLIRGAQS